MSTINVKVTNEVLKRVPSHFCLVFSFIEHKDLSKYLPVKCSIAKEILERLELSFDVVRSGYFAKRHVCTILKNKSHYSSFRVL